MEKLYELNGIQRLYLQSCYDCGVNPSWKTLKQLGAPKKENLSWSHDIDQYLSLSEIDKRDFYEK